MTYTYRELTELLQGRGIADARSEAAWLICRFCGVDRAAILTDKHRKWESAELDAAVCRRCERYPLQYIIGEWEFFGCTFRVSEDCLIPRPDTEILVEEALKILPQNAVLCDLCTGSGCIAISLLKARPDLRAVAVELSDKAVDIALENARLNGVDDRLILLCADVLADGVDKLKSLMKQENITSFDAIVSNPPYIPTEDISTLEPELAFEPKMALDGGADGLKFYRDIIKNYASLVRSGGYMLFEIGSDQARDVCALTECEAVVVRDLGGNDRVVKISL
ncbi:MAG: peptide chain release factor N(5)-glutamine methyltransferase [Ruminococcaceae bacterium]|nr:peptide chain release factor N(5)-glutamine methyltransferase [Oscillospiraceae bacterium]